MNKASKKIGLISFSGGETSAYMLYWLLKNKSDEYDFKVVFANTGRENDETLDFINKCSERFNIDIIWIESNVWGSVGCKTKHKLVSYETATRNEDWRKTRNTPYEQMVIKYGLASISNRFSTRELKDRPIQSYMRSLGYSDSDYSIFIGIRYDEIDRMKFDKKRTFIYPLIKWMKWTKKHVNFWWSQQDFRLMLKGWEGNCVFCYKKQFEKLVQIYIDNPKKIAFEMYLEFMYENYIPERRIKVLVSKLKPMPQFPLRIFRNNRSTSDIIEMSKTKLKVIRDDSEETSFQTTLFEDSESCEVFSLCGS